MPLEKALALVVRGTDWSETSRIATLFTREFGKVRAMAKGGRRLKSSFDNAFDLLTVCDIVFIKKDGEALDLLTEARVAERFPQLRQHLPALNLGYYFAELLSEGTQDYDPHPPLFDLTLATLRTLSDPKFPRGETLSRFELAWLRELGYTPRLESCSLCESDLLAQDFAKLALGFSSAAGGVLCSDCRLTVRDHRPLSTDAWQALRELAAGGGTLTRAVLKELRLLLAQTVTTVLGRRPRLLNYVEADLFGPGGT
jgi:DNA repair protein RecO (recombination protein O)